MWLFYIVQVKNVNKMYSITVTIRRGEGVSYLVQLPYYNMWKSCHDELKLLVNPELLLWSEIHQFMFVPRKPSSFPLTTHTYAIFNKETTIILYLFLSHAILSQQS